MSVVFSPVWETPSGSLGAVTEGVAVSVLLRAVQRASISLAADQTTVDLGSSTPVSEVRIGGVMVGFLQSGSSLTIAAPPLTASVANVTTSAPLSFFLLSGSLPPGLGLTPDGLISGVVRNIPAVAAMDFSFVVRVTDGARVRDRRFVMAATAVDSPPVWEEDALPSPETDEVTGFVFIRLGSPRRGDAFAYAFGASDPDGSLPTATLADPPSIPAALRGGLPPGLRFDRTTLRISGVVSLAATPGLYVFSITLDGGTVPEGTLVCGINVLSTPSTGIAPPLSVVWQTPSGMLGTLRETEPCPFTVRAETTTGAAITYALVPGLGILPPGLRINPTSGDVEGALGYVERTTDFRFVVRARSGDTFEDRAFSIRAVSVFSTESVVRIALQPSGMEREGLVEPYAFVIPQEAVFRPGDAFFGLPARASIYVIGGLDGTEAMIGDAATAGDGTVGKPRLDYHGSVEFILGDHALAFVRGNGGEVLYEVIYRRIFDPQEGVGGFSTRSSTPVEEKVLYPQTPVGSPEQYVYENSLRNIRLDLIRDLGLATDDVTLRTRPGPDGAEAMPVWMRSPQRAGDPSSALGYVAAFPVAFLKPGYGEEVLTRLSGIAARSLVQAGKVIRIGGYQVERLDLVTTLFDKSFSILPFVLSPGTTFVVAGSWAPHIEEALLVRGSDVEVWRAGIDFTASPSQITFPAPTEEASLLLLAPVGVSGTGAVNGTGTALLHLGPLFTNVVGVMINGAPVTEYLPVADSFSVFLSSPPPVGSQVVVVIDETVFEAASFDAELKGSGKYLTLPDVPGAARP